MIKIQKNKKSYLKYLNFTLFFLAIIFVSFLIASNRNTILSSNWHFNLAGISISFILLLISYLFYIKQLQSIFALDDVAINFFNLFNLTARANIAQYIPGGIWNHVSIAILIKEFLSNLVSYKKISKLIILNILITIFSGLIFFIPFIQGKLFFLAIIIYFFTLIYITNIIKFTKKKIKIIQKFIPINIDKTIVFKSIIYGLLFWIFISVSFTIFSVSLGINKDYSLFQFIKLGSSFVISWLIGFIIIPLPSGVGIREIVMSQLLEEIGLDLSLGLMISIMFRILTLVRDLTLFFLVSILFSRNKKV